VNRALIVLLSVGAVTACGSSSVKTVQSDKQVQQAEKQIEQQVSKCMPTAGGAPDPLLLRHSATRAKFQACTGVAKHGRAFDICAFKVILGHLPTVSGVEKGLTACVERVA